MSNVAHLSFFILVSAKGFSFIFPKVNAQLVIHKPVVYIGDIFGELFYWL